MIKRISIISTAVLAALLIAGLAWATPDDSSPSTTSTTQVSTAAGSQTATGSETYDAGAAGKVTVDQSGASLSISTVSANPDWASEVEMGFGREVEVKFVSGSERIDFQAELEDGVVRTRVRTRTLDGSTDDDSDDSNNSDDSNDDSFNDSDDDNSGRSHDDDHDSDDEGSTDDSDDSGKDTDDQDDSLDD